MDVPWTPSVLALDAVQAALVALPAAGLPAALARWSGRWWALIPPVSIIGVVYAITAAPGFADGLTWIALIACPPLAAAALGWAMHGARPRWAWAVVPLGAVAWIWSGELAGHLAAVAITALSCVTLARLLHGVAPPLLLKLGVIAMAVSDAVLILSDQLQQPNATLSAAAPAIDLPRLQVAIVDPARLGYGDLFLAAVLGAILAAEAGPRTQRRYAVLLFVLIVAFDALFLVLDSLPATVPVAVALLIYEGAKHAGRRRLARSSAASEAR